MNTIPSPVPIPADHLTEQQIASLRSGPDLDRRLALDVFRLPQRERWTGQGKVMPDGEVAWFNKQGNPVVCPKWSTQARYRAALEEWLADRGAVIQLILYPYKRTYASCIWATPGADEAAVTAEGNGDYATLEALALLCLLIAHGHYSQHEPST